VVFSDDKAVTLGGLARNVGHMSYNMFSCYNLLSSFCQQKTCCRHCDWESILVMCQHISRHNIFKASAKLACWTRCHPMSSWASHDIAHVSNTSHDTSPSCQHVCSWHVRWGV
jgi:hypothetical protein